jgi:hypothetical protein
MNYNTFRSALQHRKNQGFMKPELALEFVFRMHFPIPDVWASSPGIETANPHKNLSLFFSGPQEKWNGTSMTVSFQILSDALNINHSIA